MSLINDALRKARREAAARGEHPDTPEMVVILSPRRSLAHRPGLVLALGALLVAALLLGASVAWWAMNRTVRAGSAAGSATGAGDARGEAVPASAGTPREPRAGSESRREPASARTAAGAPAPTPARRAAAPPPSTPVAAGGGPSSAAAPRPPRRPTPASASPRRTVPAASREFLGEAKVGGITLTLDYLVYRPSDPFVQINGVELHEGWEISGFTVKRIQTDRVILEGPGGRVVIRSR